MKLDLAPMLFKDDDPAAAYGLANIARRQGQGLSGGAPKTASPSTASAPCCRISPI